MDTPRGSGVVVGGGVAGVLIGVRVGIVIGGVATVVGGDGVGVSVEEEKRGGETGNGELLRE